LDDARPSRDRARKLENLAVTAVCQIRGYVAAGSSGCASTNWLGPGPERTTEGTAVRTRPGYRELNHGTRQRNRLCLQNRVVTVRMAREYAHSRSNPHPATRLRHRGLRDRRVGCPWVGGTVEHYLERRAIHRSKFEFLGNIDRAAAAGLRALPAINAPGKVHLGLVGVRANLHDRYRVGRAVPLAELVTVVTLFA
jgi:hypothetical protein